MIVEFGRRTGMQHNCHMTDGKKDLWNVKNKKLECYGSKNGSDIKVVDYVKVIN